MTTPLPTWVRFVAPIVVGVLILAAWILWVDVIGAPRALPSPGAVVGELVNRWPIISEDVLADTADQVIWIHER